MKPTSTDPRTRGTVSSRKVWTHPVVSHGPEKVLVKYFNEIYTEADQLKKEVRKKNFFLTNIPTRSKSSPTSRDRPDRSAQTRAKTDQIIAKEVSYYRRKGVNPPTSTKRRYRTKRSKPQVKTPRKRNQIDTDLIKNVLR